MTFLGKSLAVTGGVGVLVGGYLGLVSGAVSIDLGVGRRLRPLGPLRVDIAAPREVVFDVLSEPYLGRQSRTVAEKIRVLERGTDLVLAAHRTRLRGRLVATTVETVRFVRPERVEFRLTRGPVAYVREQFLLTDTTTDTRTETGTSSDTGSDTGSSGTRLEYTGELGTDLWALGARWGELVAGPWQRTVAASFTAVTAEAERRARQR